MKTEELNKIAQEVMKLHKVSKVYATKDGNVFLPANLNSAQFHAKQTKQELFTIEIETVPMQEQPVVENETEKTNKTTKK